MVQHRGMAKRLRVRRTADGVLGVECTRCNEIVAPLYIDCLDYWNCPECDQTFDPVSLRGYQKALRQAADEEGWEEYGA